MRRFPAILLVLGATTRLVTAATVALAAIIIISGYAGPPASSALSSPPGYPPVDMLSDRFSPASITITSGEMITWIGVKGSHTATSYDGLWDSGRVKSGGTYSFTFTQPGVYRYLCVYHEDDGMVGEVIVTAPPSPPQEPPPTPPPSDPQPDAPTTPSPSDPQPEAPTTPPTSDPQPQVLAGAGTPDGSVASSPQSSASSLPRTSSSQPQTSASAGGLPGTGGEPPEAGSGRPWGSAALPLVAGLGLAMIGITLFRFGAASKH
jgi:plastocyanin